MVQLLLSREIPTLARLNISTDVHHMHLTFVICQQLAVS